MEVKLISHNHGRYHLLVLSYFTVLVLGLWACGAPNGRFRVEGKFKNINQAEFFIYSLEQGRKDTIKVNEGRFIYEIPQKDTSTLILLFPNFYELPIFAQSGAVVTIKGDVSHLKEATITGTQENDEMTAFRLRTNDMMPPEVKKEAEAFITENPQSLVSLYLLRRYFLLGPSPDYDNIYHLCDTMLQSRPSYVPLVQLHQQLQGLKNKKTEGRLPSFSTTDTTGKTITNQFFSGKDGVILVWASWSFDSQNMLHEVRNLQKVNKSKDLRVMSICLDAATSEGRKTLERDSIEWPNVCSGELWDTPVVSQLGISAVPDNILVGKDGTIKGRGLTTKELIEQLKDLLK